jgi:hypothetical protein
MRVSMPGFTAETSLSRASVRHQGTPGAPCRGDIVQPASSDVILLNPPLMRAGFRRRDVFDPCYWRHRCQHIYDPRPELRGNVLFTQCWVERVCP